jgi:hypothetical protein
VAAGVGAPVVAGATEVAAPQAEPHAGAALQQVVAGAAAQQVGAGAGAQQDGAGAQHFVRLTRFGFLQQVVSQPPQVGAGAGAAQASQPPQVLLRRNRPASVEDEVATTIVRAAKAAKANFRIIAHPSVNTELGFQSSPVKHGTGRQFSAGDGVQNPVGATRNWVGYAKEIPAIGTTIPAWSGKSNQLAQFFPTLRIDWFAMIGGS